MSKLEICFTGFEIAHREKLELKAIHDGCRVRRRITPGLRVLVLGDEPDQRLVDLAITNNIARLPYADYEQAESIHAWLSAADAVPLPDDSELDDAADLTLWQRLSRKTRRDWFRLVAKGSAVLFVYFLVIGLCSALFGAVVGATLMILTFFGILLRLCLKLLGPSSSV